MNKKILISAFMIFALFLSAIFYLQQRKSAQLVYERFIAVYQEQFDQKSKAVASSVYNDLLSYNVISAAVRLKQLVALGQFSGFKIVQGEEEVESYNYSTGPQTMESIQPIRFSADELWGKVHFVTSNTEFASVSKTSVTFVNSFVVFFVVMILVGLILLISLYASAKYLDHVLLSYFTPAFKPSPGGFYLFWNKLLDNLQARNESYLAQAKEIDRIKKIEIFEEVARQVAHDIRSPLATLNTLLAKNDSDSSGDQALTRLAIERIQNIARDLLMRNHAAANVSKQSTPFYLPNLLSDFTSEQRARFGSKIKLTVEAEFNSPLREIPVSANDLLRVLANLTNNAIEASKKETLHLKLKVIESAHQIVIEVSDDGPGIAPELLGQLGHKGASFNKIHGHGLGLYHAKKLLTECGGGFEIASQLDVGTCVSLSLPATSLQMILVDDDPLVRLTWQSQAAAKRISLTTFESAHDLRIHLSTFSSEDLIYLDYSLGGEENGASLARHLRECDFKHLYLVSGQDDISTEEQGLFSQVRGKEFPFN